MLNLTGRPWFELRFGEIPVTVRDDEHFELAITVLDENGAALASMSHTRKMDVDPWTGSDIERND